MVSDAAIDRDIPATTRDARGGAGVWQLLCAVTAASFAAPLVKLSQSDPLLLAFWRVALAAAGAGVVLVAQRLRARARRATAGAGAARTAPASASASPPSPAPNPIGAIFAGVLLGLHFWVWIASLSYTSVANSVLLVTTQPVWAAIAASIFLRERVPPLGWAGIALALSGSAVSIGFAGVAIRGDLMALAGAMLAAGYMVVGRRERQTWDTVPYLVRVYGAAAVTLAAALVATGTPFAPARAADWGVFAALAAIPTGLGHSLYNWVLKHLPAYVVATSITLEPVGSSILAYWWTAEVPSQRAFLVAPVIFAGILLVAWSQRRAAAPAIGAPPPT